MEFSNMETPTRLRHLLRGVISLALIISSLSLTAQGQQVSVTAQPRPTRPFPSARYIPDHDFDTRHIALDLRFDWEKEQLLGRETIVFAPLVQSLSAISLDAANITPTSIKLVSASSAESAKPLQFVTEADKERVVVTLDRAYKPSEELTLVIDYRTNGPQDTKLVGLTGVGLKFLKPGPDDPARPKQIWSQGESEYNHYWFLCYDHPNDFFTSEITATVEKPMQVVSNGRLVETKENSDGTRSFHWKIDQPHASYLTSIVVGEYTAVTGDYDGIPITTDSYPKEAAEAKLTTPVYLRW